MTGVGVIRMIIKMRVGKFHWKEDWSKSWWDNDGYHGVRFMKISSAPLSFHFRCWWQKIKEEKMNEKEKAVIEAAVEYFYSGKEGVRFQILNLAVQNYLISQKATEHISDMAEKLISDVMNNREKLVKAWIAETGIRPDEAEIIERRDGNTVYI